MNLFIIFIIAVSLSMDAFFFFLAYGTLNIRKKDIYTLSVIVGMYHLFMPIIGHFVGNKFAFILPIASNFFIFIILVLIAFEMIIDSIKKTDSIKVMNIKDMILFGLTVSIDSFSVGLGIDTICNNILYSSLIFSLTSFIFTLIGLLIGKKINRIFGNISTLFGGVVLILIAIIYVV